MNAFGTPNLASSLDMCGWGRGFATRYTFGVGSVGSGPGGAMPDIANSGCLILWGYNPSISRLTHATATVAALKRGMRLIVVDPRRVGLANKADVWLRVRPGTDGALALGLANVMIERGWYDRDFVRDWSNGPHPGARRHRPPADRARPVAGRERAAPSRLGPGSGAARSSTTRPPAATNGDDASLALEGEYRIATRDRAR